MIAIPHLPVKLEPERISVELCSNACKRHTLSLHQISGHKPTSFNHHSLSILTSSLKLKLILEEKTEEEEEEWEEAEEEAIEVAAVVAIEVAAVDSEEEEDPEVEIEEDPEVVHDDH